MAETESDIPTGDLGYRMLVESVVDYAIYMLDPTGRVLNWNAGAERAKGYTPAEIIGEHFSRFYTEEDRASGLPQRALATAEREGRFEAEGWRVRKDGSRFWALVVIDAIRRENGELVGFAKVARDMTERKIVHDTLLESERRFRHLVQSVTDYAIYMLDTEGRVVNWNPGAQRFKGYLPDEIIGEHFSRFYTEADRAAGIPELALKTALETGRFEAEGWRVRKDGSQFWAMVVIDPVRDETGELIGFAKVTRDMSERRQADLKLQQTREQLFQSQKVEALGQLTGGLAHDFNNLLTVIIGGSEMARRLAGDNERLVRLLDGVHSSAQRGAALTRQLLAFARRQPLKPVVIDIRDQLEQTSRLLRSSLGGAIEVAVSVEGESLRAEVDPSQLDLVLLNLGLNGRDAMASGGRLTLSAERVRLIGQIEDLYGDFIALSVIDTGCGIPEEMRDRILEPFFTTKPLGQGTGLGLSQAYGFAKQSNGALAIESEVGRGTRVILYLPATDRAVTAEVSSADPSRSGDRRRILLVEDDAAVAQLAEELIREVGYPPEVAPNAAAALQRLSNGETFDLVISDIMMPGEMNGLDLVRRIRELQPAMPIVLTTGYSEAASMSTPDFPVLHKPYQIEDLKRVLADALGAPGTGGR